MTPLDAQKAREKLLLEIFKFADNKATCGELNAAISAYGSQIRADKTTTSTTETDESRPIVPADKPADRIGTGNVGTELESRHAAQLVGGGSQIRTRDEVESLNEATKAAFELGRVSGLREGRSEPCPNCETEAIPQISDPKG